MRISTKKFAWGLLIILNLCAHASQETGDRLLRMTAIGDTQAVIRLLESGAPIDALSEHNDTALHIAALKGHADTVQALLHRGAAVDNINPGMTPLMCALLQNHRHVAKVLLECGANTTALNASGQTALHIVLWKYPEPHARALIKLLLSQGAYVDTKNRAGLRPLNITTQKHQVAAAQLLLSYDAELTDNPPMPDKLSTEWRELWHAQLIAMRNERLRAIKQWHQHLMDQKQMPRDLANLVLKCALPKSHITKLHSLGSV